MKRSLLLIAVLAVLAVFVTACAQPTPEVVEKVVTVEVEKQVEVTPMPAEMPQFPDAKLEMIMRASFIPDMNKLQENQIAQWAEMTGAEVEGNWAREWREMTAAAIESESGADIVELFQNTTHVYAEKLADVSDIAEALEAEYGPWYDAANQISVVDGKWLSIPRAYTAHAINYRMDVFSEAGWENPPETWDEYLQACTAIFEAGLPPCGNTMSQTGPNDSASFAYSVLWSFGGKEVEEDGVTVAINSPETRAALEYMKALAAVSSPDITGYDEGGNNRAFLAGEISATQNATSIYHVAKSQAPDIAENMSHFKYPAGPAGHQQFIEMNLLAVPAFGDVEAAKALVAWMMEPEQLGPLAQIGITFYTPMLEGYDDMPNMPWNIDPKLAPLKGLAKSGHLAGWPGPASRESGEAYANQTLVNMFASVIGGEDIEAAVLRAEEELKAVYEN